ncbi:MAG: DUF3880 domain-containing protein, partial [Lachnospiraceae bacterium]|nr:DUF3880 domain-containing protein [Lachnospiraceae bacterium]
MKALFYRYNNICERDVLQGFRELGVEIRELMHAEGKPSDVVRAVTGALQEEPADFVFSIDFFPMVAESCRLLQIRYLCWTVDSPVLTLYAKQVAYDCNRIFCFDSAQAREIAAFNPGHVHYLPLAAPVEARQAAIKACDEPEHFAARISFVGSLYEEQCDYDRHEGLAAYLSGYLDGLIEAGSRLHDIYLPELTVTEEMATEFHRAMQGFPVLPGESFLTDRVVLTQLLMANKMTSIERHRLIARLGKRFGIDVWTGSNTDGMTGVHNRGFANTARVMPVVFAASDININHTMRGIRTGVSLRVWDILSCGGFCLTDAQPDLY